MAKITDFQEIKRKTRRKKAIRKVVSFTFFVTIVLLCTYIFSKYPINEIKANVITVFSGNNEEGYPISTPGGKIIDVSSQNGNLLLVNDINMYAYSPKGVEVMNVQHSYQHPIISSDGKKSVIFTRGDSKFTLYDSDKIDIEKKIDNKIYNLDVSKDGKVAVASTSPKGRSRVDVYGKSGKEIFSWISFDKTAVMPVLDENGDYLAVSNIYTQEGLLMSNITVLKTNDKKYTKEITLENEIVFYLGFKGKNIEVITDKRAAIYSRDGKNTANYLFANQELFTYAVNGSNTVLVLGDYHHNRNYNIISLSDKYEVLGENVVLEKILDIKLGNEIIYVLENNKVECYGLKTQFLEVVEANDVYQIQPIGGYLYTISQNNIKKINAMLIAAGESGEKKSDE